MSNDEYIDAFFGDANVQRLIGASAVSRPLQICFPNEINISRFLAWLLDPSQGHGLGDLALQSLLVRSWSQSREVTMELSDRRFIAPSNVRTEGFSSVVVTTEVKLDGRSLDVLVLDVNRRRFYAIENKFGASQSNDQLADYRSSLESLLDGFRGIYIYLDTNEAVPDDPAWIPVGYDWLADFLREAEQRPSTASHVRQTLEQFRTAIEYETEDTMGATAQGLLVSEVASGHPEVLKMMSPWSRASKGNRAKLLVELWSNATTNDGKATLRLAQLYWKRPAIWDHCIKQTHFAPFVSAMRETFQDLEIDPKRVRTGFSLKRWDALIDQEQFEDYWFYAAGVNVYQSNEKFTVTTYIHLQNVSAEKRDALIDAAIAMRASHQNGRAIRDAQSFVVLKRTPDLTQGAAIKEVSEGLYNLREALEPLLR